MSETLELVRRVREETTVRMSAVVVNRVLPELFGRARGGDLRAAARAGDRGAALRARRRLGRPGARSGAPRRHHATHPLHPPAAAPGRAAGGAPGAAPPVPLLPQLRRTHDPPGGPRPRRGARAVSATGGGAKTVGQLLAAKEIVIACGPGGVGKTTTAAALAATAVVQQGGHVLVLTVDPARRLADALGLKGIGNDEVRIPDEVFTGAAAHPRGELWAAMLDTKQSWDDLVRTPRAGRRDPGADPGQPAVPEHLGPIRPVPRLHRHGAPLRDPLRGRRTTSSWSTRRPRATRSTSSTRRSGWPTSSPRACCAG